MARTTQHVPPFVRKPSQDAVVNSIQSWLEVLNRWYNSGPAKVPGYSKTALPAAATYGSSADFSSVIYVYDEAGGAVLAFSDGAHWRRVTDRAIVS